MADHPNFFLAEETGLHGHVEALSHGFCHDLEDVVDGEALEDHAEEEEVAVPIHEIFVRTAFVGQCAMDLCSEQ